LKKERIYYLILGTLVFIFIVVQLLKPPPLDWTESFSSEDKIPYGGYLIHALLPTAFPENELSENQAPLFELEDSTNANQNWIFMNTAFSLDKWETRILLSQVNHGADVFIAARQFGGAFGDSLGIKTAMNSPFLGAGNILKDDTVHVHFSNPQLEQKGGFPYYRSTTETYFTDIDSTLTVTQLGANNVEKPNYIRIPFGEGNLYLHTNPTLFTNYFVRDEISADYALKALSYLPERATIWDDYYKDVRTAGQSAMRYIVSEQYLKWAWLLGISGVLLFMIFRAKRSQRIIPVIEAPKNSSIEFARTIGSLYLEKGDHKLIAEKKIRFFLDYIRTNLRLETTTVDDELKKDIALRSGLDETAIHTLFDVIDAVSSKEDLTQNELKLLTEKIDQFYKQSQR
jgi:hypothetical protein